MKRGIVPGEPGIFPAPFAKWYAKLFKDRKPKGDVEAPPEGRTDEGDGPDDSAPPPPRETP